MQKKLRQIEKRISLISAWIAGFDTVCEAREEQEEPPAGLVAMRKTAQGILAELESSRQHYHQRLSKNNWERAVTSALDNGIRQLKEADGSADPSGIASLTREAELLKSNADRDVYTAMLDQEKGGDAAVVQVLLQAHFETVAILGQIMQMDERDAIQAARTMLGKLLKSCSDATSQVIKPDGGLPVTELFPPTRHGTPKRRKPVNLMGPSPMKVLPRPSIMEKLELASSPMKGSPRRRKLGGAKKGVSFTPKKKSPVKGMKRGVRWRDDTEDGTLAEFQATPQGQQSTPDLSSAEPLPPSLPAMLTAPEGTGSSPIPAPMETSIQLLSAKTPSSRFQTGFLSKRPDGSGSPAPPTLSYLSSDSEASPLREMAPNSAPHRLSSSLHVVENVPNSSDVTPNDSAASGSEDDGKSYKLDGMDTKKIRSAIKRTSSQRSSDSNRAQSHRRRSPTAASQGSPPSENALFTASHARRMVKSDRGDDGKGSVLSPRTAPVVKNGQIRRTTMGEGMQADRKQVRVSSVTPGSANRGSMMGGKSVWR